MIFLTEKERTLLSKAPNKKFIVTYTFGKEIKSVEITGKSCGAIPLADEVSVFAIYDETGVESFVCDFSNFISVVEKKGRSPKRAARLKVVAD